MSYSWATGTTVTSDSQNGQKTYLYSGSAPLRWITVDGSAEGSVSPVEYAVYFVATQQGGPSRILRRHRRAPNGLCSGCLSRPTVHPCQAARIAQLAELHPAYRSEKTTVNVTNLRIPTLLRDLDNTTRRTSRRKRRR
jgi:hypothetical protein